jgi:hypothetical protein
MAMGNPMPQRNDNVTTTINDFSKGHKKPQQNLTE